MTKDRLKKIKKEIVEKISNEYKYANLTPKEFGIMFEKAIINLDNQNFNDIDDYFNKIYILISSYIEKYIKDMVKEHEYIYIYKNYLLYKHKENLASNIMLIINFIKKYEIFSILDYLTLIKNDTRTSEIIKKLYEDKNLLNNLYLTANDKEIINKLLNAYRILNNIPEKKSSKKKKNQTILDKYYEEIINYENLSKEEEIDAFKRYYDGDMEARNIIINSNLRLVASIAEKFSNNDNIILDLIEEGNIGLIRAIDKFNLSLGYRFTTYATYWIRESIIYYLKYQTRMISFPNKVIDILVKIEKVKKDLTILLGKEPTLEDISLEIGLPIEKINYYLSLPEVSFSLEMPIGNSEILLKDLIPDYNDINPENLYCGALDIIDNLEDKEKEIVKYRIGYNDEVKTVYEIGEIYGISPQRVSQIYKRAIKKLKRYI